MAKFNLSTNHARDIRGDRFSVVFHLTGQPDPFPQRQIEARKPADALAELEAYKAEVAAAVGEPVVVSLRLARGERAPNGWKAAEKASPFYHLVRPVAATVEGAPFLVGSIESPDLYWSNSDGWGDKTGATRFTLEERARFNLPMGGKWVEG